MSVTQAVFVPGLQVIGPHNPSHTMLATGLACFAQVKKDPRGTVDAVACRIGRADQAKQPLVLHRSIGEGVP
jgi:hypothetical protein